MIKNLWQAAKAKLGGYEKTQAGARSAQSNALNYRSVDTLDPSRLARAFTEADQGFVAAQAALFELIEERDAHVFADLSKRRRAVTGLGWQVETLPDAPQGEVDRAKELEAMLKSIPRFEDTQYDLTDAIGKGFVALEFDWKTGDVWLPQAVHFVPQRMFCVDKKSGALLLLKDGVPEPLRPWGWLVHEHKAKSGYIEQAALFRVLAWAYAYKTYNVRDMQRFLELYGMPLRLGKYPAGIAKAQRDELLRAVKSIGNDGAGVVPNTMAIEFVQASGGRVDDFSTAIEYWERKQSMAILGGTLTSQADGKTSTNALGVIHDKIRREIMLHDVRQIEPSINAHFLRPIALINGMFTEDRLPRFKYLTEETVDQAKMVSVLNWSANLGMQIDLDYAHKVMQIPRAKEGADLLVLAGGKVPSEAGKEAGKEAGLSLVYSGLKSAALTQNAPDYATAFSAQLAALCVPHEEALISAIGGIIAECGDFEAAALKIEALKLANPAWDQAIGEGMLAANLAGRFEVSGVKA